MDFVGSSDVLYDDWTNIKKHQEPASIPYFMSGEHALKCASGDFGNASNALFQLPLMNTIIL